MDARRGRRHRRDIDPKPSKRAGRSEALDGPRREQERRLARQAGDGREVAVGRLVDANLRQVVRIARRYDQQGVALMDLITRGTVGLAKAARNYDERRDGEFTPYALRAARREIRSAVGA